MDERHCILQHQTAMKKLQSRKFYLHYPMALFLNVERAAERRNTNVCAHSPTPLQVFGQ